MDYKYGVPTVTVKDLPIRMMKIDGSWYAEVYEQLMAVRFPKGEEKLPYPLSYFRN